MLTYHEEKGTGKGIAALFLGPIIGLLYVKSRNSLKIPKSHGKSEAVLTLIYINESVSVNSVCVCIY